MSTRVMRGFLSDMDGTLVGTRNANFFAYRDALHEFGLVLSEEDFAPTWGMDSRVFLPELFPHLDEAAVTAIRIRKADLYPHFVDDTTLNAPLAALLWTLSDNYPIGLVTTAKAGNVASILEHHGLGELFTTVVCGDDVAQGKPAPDPYLLALTRLGLAAHQVTTFEDSAMGVESAERAGVHVVRVTEYE